MKKNLSRLLCALLCLSLLLTACTGAGKQTGNNKVGTETNKDTETNKGAETNKDAETNNEQVEVEKVLEETGNMLIQNGKSAYKIVLPQNKTTWLTLAAEELQEFLKLATGVTLAIVSDSNVTDSDSVISLGRTKIAEKLGVKATETDDLGTSGYIMKTVGNQVVIVDAPTGDGEGVLYGVYDFLYDAIKFKVYAADEIVYDKKSDVQLYEYDEKATPSFDERSMSYPEILYDETFTHRMRLFDQYNTSKWGLFGHTQLEVLPPRTYAADHPDWYTSDQTQLCYSSGDDMVTTFANNLIEIIKQKPDATYFQIAHSDTQTICNCSKCKEALEKYDGLTGLEISFLNRVIEKTEAWRAKNAPNRDVRYVFFAYQTTLQPAVKKDANGNWVPYHKDCTMHEKLYVYFAPVAANYAVPLEDNRNQKEYNALKQWNAIAPGRLMVYLYDINFRNYLVNFNNFNVMQKQFETYKENGTNFIYCQGPIRVSVPCFTEMRIFVESQLLWNLKLKYDDLVTEFMDVYYGAGGAAMRKYYDYLCKNYENKKDFGGIYSALGSSDVYSYEMMAVMDAYIDEALQAIEPLRNTDNERFATLYFRIKKEAVSNLWLKLNTFNLYYSEDELNDFALEFYFLIDKFGLTHYKESLGEIGYMFEGFVK